MLMPELRAPHPTVSGGNNFEYPQGSRDFLLSAAIPHASVVQSLSRIDALGRSSRQLRASGDLAPAIDSATRKLKGTKTTIGALSWHLSPASGIIRRGLLPPLPCNLPAPRPRRLLPAVRIGQGHRDNGAAAPGTSSRTAGAGACPVRAGRPSDPRSVESPAPSSTVAVLSRHARHSPALAPGARQAQVATMASTAGTWLATDKR
jgi:hypothetical protein